MRSVEHTLGHGSFTGFSVTSSAGHGTRKGKFAGRDRTPPLHNPYRTANGPGVQNTPLAAEFVLRGGHGAEPLRYLVAHVMRMSHYYMATALLLIPALLATLVSGAFSPGSGAHMYLGLFTSMGCVLQSTLLILFMIVTGRVLRQAVALRNLPPPVLERLHEFFAHRATYPAALLAAFAAVAAAVLGHGEFIGVPVWVHMLTGLAACLVNLWTIGIGLRTLRGNQSLIDDAAHILDRIDAEMSEEEAEELPDGGVEWKFGPRTRWLIFAACAWLPYVYWGAIVWHGDFERISPLFSSGTAVVSALAFAFSFVTPGPSPNTKSDATA